MVGKDLILLKDVNYFGRVIKKGSTFKKCETNNDYYYLFENKDGILMECPDIRIHFTMKNREYFIEQYGEELPKLRG